MHTNDFLDKLNKAIKNKEKLDKINNYFDSYAYHYYVYANYLLNSNHYQLHPNLFKHLFEALDFPLHNFTLFEGKLFQISEYGILNRRENLHYNIEGFNFEYAESLMNALIKIVKYGKTSSTLTANYIDIYIIDNKLQEHQNRHILFYPENFLLRFNNNLYYKNYDLHSIDNSSPPIFLADLEGLKKIFTHFNLPYPKISTFKEIYKLFDTKEFFEDIRPAKNTIFFDDHSFCKYENKLIKFSNNEAKLSNRNNGFDKSTKTNINSLINLDLEDITKHLHWLCNGNIKTLINFSIMCSDLLSATNNSKKIHIIIADPIVKEYIMGLLDFITEQNFIEYENWKNFITNKNFMSLIKYPYPYKFILFNSPKKIEKEGDIRFIKKIIACKSVPVKNDFKKFNFNNHSAFVAITDNNKVLFNYTNNFPSNVIDLQNLNLDIIPQLEDMSIISFIQVFLSTYGLKILNNSKIKQTKINKNDHQYNITHFFFKTFCSYDKNSFVYTRDLHTSYLYFYRATYSDDPLTKQGLTKEFKAIIGESKYNSKITYKRPHVNREYNGYAFMSLRLDTDKINAWLEENNTQKPSTEYLEFSDYIQKIYKLGRQPFDDLINRNS